jgi:hypothetical protein
LCEGFGCRPLTEAAIVRRTVFVDAHWPTMLARRQIMHLSSQGLLVIIVVGIVAGWLAGRVMEGGGFGPIGDLLVGLWGIHR